MQCIDVAYSYRCSMVCVSVCVSVGYNREACKMAELIKLLFGVWTWVGSEDCVLDGGLDMPRGRVNYGGHLPALL